MIKSEKFFFVLISLESIILGILYVFFQNSCGSPCDTHSLLNPFGLNQPKICAPFCAQTLHPYTYIIADILIITIVFYTLISIYKYIKWKKALK